jgi:hypothetical protein
VSADRSIIGRKLVLLTLAVVLCARSSLAEQARLPARVATVAVWLESAAGDSGDKNVSGWKLGVAFFGAVVACFGLGAALGRRYSPNYEDSRKVAEYVSRTVKTEYSGSYEKLPWLLGTLTIVPGITYYFPVGATSWVYDSKSKTLRQEAYDRARHGEQPPVKAMKGKIPEALNAFTFLPLGTEVLRSGVDLKEMVRSLTNAQRWRLGTLMVMAALSGALVGFVLAYRAKPNRQSKEFGEQLKNPTFWEAVAKGRGWIFEEAGGRVLVKTLSDGVYLNVQLVPTYVAGLPGVSSKLIAGSVVVKPVPYKSRFTPPPPEVLEALKAMGESQMAERLAAQAGQLYLGVSIFPISSGLKIP